MIIVQQIIEDHVNNSLNIDQLFTKLGSFYFL